MTQCFISQVATEQILLRVTNVCAECYCDLKVGDVIHYDNQRYHYVCQKCQEAYCEQMNEKCDVVEGEDGGLFC